MLDLTWLERHEPALVPGAREALEAHGEAPHAPWLVEAAVLHVLAPGGYLFLCVANSARSQLAEGLARDPEGTWIASAGSQPTSVRPEAVAALAERGIPMAAHRSKGMDEVDASRVEVVVTLCAEEVCPAWLGQALRVHWGLPDPAAVEGPGRLDAFRAARDELERRLSVVFRPPPRGRVLRGVRVLTPVQARAELEEGALQVDLRSERAIMGRVIGVGERLWSPRRALVPESLPRDRLLLLVDSTGVHARGVAQQLQAQGLERVAILGGGLAEWHRGGLPTEVDRGELPVGSCACQVRPARNWDA